MQPSEDEKTNPVEHFDQEISSIDIDLGDASGFIGHGEAIILDERASRKLLWKIDLYLLPILGLLYMLQFLDKTIISFAAVMGIVKDADLTGNRFNWLGSVFYIGYLVAEYPANLALQRLPIAKFLSTQIVLWGGVATVMGVCKNFSGLLALRIFLGVFESSITPGFILIVSQWWRKEEQALRTGIWCACNGLSQVFGGLVAYGIAVSAKHQDRLEGWQTLFLSTGVLTVLCGVLFFFMIPDSPSTAWFLSREEKIMLFERQRSNHQSTGNKTMKRYQVIEALTDPMTWLYAIFAVAITIPAGDLSNFKNVILEGFGLSPEKALLYNAPGGAFMAIANLIICYLADRTKNRCLWGIFSLVLPVVCFILMLTLLQHGMSGQLIEFTFAGTFLASFTLVLSLIASNVAGQTKKTVVNTVTMIGYCIGFLIGPFTVHLSDAPRYVIAKITICALFSFSSLVLVAIRLLAGHRNSAKEKKLAELGISYQHVHNQEFMDLTDIENLEFRYVL